ncbi:hypothetical protein VPUCM_1419 [Vibrio parahaemolyticus UCM-V493]|nr:hypothetical protein VPUCM_1347 [Vibrio parahaemolyticus UCM-V493]AHI99377.1 hypothetical protein VPUCM_1419 [Vibrio parahaemolyticus UCM-V493]
MILDKPSFQPFTAPYFEMHCLVYSEHVGSKLHSMFSNCLDPPLT